jgi:hypothetical protein
MMKNFTKSLVVLTLLNIILFTSVTIQQKQNLKELGQSKNISKSLARHAETLNEITESGNSDSDSDSGDDHSDDVSEGINEEDADNSPQNTDPEADIADNLNKNGTINNCDPNDPNSNCDEFNDDSNNTEVIPAPAVPVVQDYQKTLGECLDAWYNFYVDILGKFNVLKLMEVTQFKLKCGNFNDTYFNSGYYCQTLVADFKATMDDASWCMVSLNYKDAQAALTKA